MENNNLHSFDEQLKAAMEQFSPTPPADVWANVSSQIGNISTVSQVTLATKIATIISKNIILITTSAAVVASAIIYVVSTNDNKNTISPKKEETKQTIVVDNNEVKPNQQEEIIVVEKVEEIKPQNKNIQNKPDAEIPAKEKIVKQEIISDRIATPSEKVIEDAVKEKPVSAKDKLIQKILNENQNPVENQKPLPISETVKKCNTGTEIKESYIGNNYYQFESTISQLNFSCVWYLGDGYIQFNVPKITHYYNENEEDSYIVSLVLTKDGCKDSITKLITFYRDQKLNIYNIFTPNGDAKNDYWNIQVENTEMYELRVMDYKGELVFETKNKDEKWNGQKYNIGENCPNGTYTYLLYYKINGQEKANTLKGRVDLNR